jgi:hypothetical protein
MQLLIKYVEEKIEFSKPKSESIHRVCKAQLYALEKIALDIRWKQKQSNHKVEWPSALTHLKSLSMRSIFSKYL